MRKTIITCIYLIIFSFFTVNGLFSLHLNWMYVTGGKITSLPVVNSDGTVFFISEDRHLYAVDEEGDDVWKHRISGKPLNSLCITQDDTIIYATSRGNLIGINKMGKKIWETSLYEKVAGEPAVNTRGEIFVLTEKGSLIALSHKGVQKWSLKLPTVPTTPIYINKNGTLYFGLKNNKFYAYYPWGERKWSATLQGAADIVALEGGNVYIGTKNGFIFAFNEEGKSQWIVNNAGDSITNLFVDTSKNVYYTTYKGTFGKLSSAGLVLANFNFNETFAGRGVLDSAYNLIIPTGGKSIITISPRGTVLSRIEVKRNLMGITWGKGSHVFAAGNDWSSYKLMTSAVPLAGWSQFRNGSGHLGSLDKAGASINAFVVNSPEYKGMYNLAFKTDVDMKDQILDEIERNFKKKKAEGYSYCYQIILEELAGEGIFNPVFDSNFVENDYPEIRMRAVELLGRYGSLVSRSFLIQLLEYEFDVYARVQIINALGEIGSDNDGKISAALNKAVEKLTFPDERIAGAAINAFVSIVEYNGMLPGDENLEFLISLFSGDYPKGIREQALRALDNIQRMARE